jgi:ATP-dependent RNA helicase DeaD
MIAQADREDHTYTPPPEAAPADGPPRIAFSDLGLRPEVMRALADMGFGEPMEVQAVTLPLIREGRDIMTQSRTGSGKTAAFGIPLADQIAQAEHKHVQAIVLMPTRELALQVAAEIARISAHTGLQVVPIYGGAPMGRQIEQLRAGAQIVCGTPGRVLDHLRRGTLKLDRVKCAVLDECDEMLSMGFQEDIEAILERTPQEQRQTLLFSATMPEGIQRLARRFMRDPELVKLSADFVGVHEIRHTYYSIPGGQREAELVRVLAFENPERALIFCNTREETGRVAEYLRKQGLDAEAISSDLSQSDRERVMTRMRAGSIRFLVATDVAARGIDLENLPFVINYTFPESPEIYIHRTGRTGRAGRSGHAVSLIGPTEVGSFYYLKLLYKIRPEERSLPSEAELRSRREGESLLRLRTLLPGDPGAEWCSLARRLMAAVDGERLVGAMLRGVLEKHKEVAAAGEVAGVAESTASHTPAEAREAPAPPRARYDRERDRERGRERGDRDRRGRRAERERPSRERPGGERERSSVAASEQVQSRREPQRERPAQRPNAPAGDTRATSGEPREFWEVWSEEVGRTPAAAPATAGAAEATAPATAPPAVPATAPATAPPAVPATAPATALAAAPATAPSYQAPAPGQVRLYLNLGRKDGASADSIAELLAGTGVPVPAREIETMNTHSYVNLPAAEGERLCAALAGREHEGRAIVCEPARPPKRR